MTQQLPSKTLSVWVNRDASAVYEFLSEPANFALWASGLGDGFQKSTWDGWVANTPEGAVRIRFTPLNAYGVLDHTVTLPNGAEVYVPMRVIANGEGAEVTFTLFRQPEMDDDKFAADQDWVLKDLAKLKQVIESWTGTELGRSAERPAPGLPVPENRSAAD